MLVLSRKVGQSLVIADGVTVTVSEIGPDFVRLTVTTPNEAEVRSRYPQRSTYPRQPRAAIARSSSRSRCTTARSSIACDVGCRKKNRCRRRAKRRSARFCKPSPRATNSNCRNSPRRSPPSMAVPTTPACTTRTRPRNGAAPPQAASRVKLRSPRGISTSYDRVGRATLDPPYTLPPATLAHAPRPTR